MNTDKIKRIPDVTLYLFKGDIPWFQRSWIWGCGALVIFICGLCSALLLKNCPSPEQSPAMASNNPSDLHNLLTLQQATNSGLQEEVNRLQNILDGGVCKAATSAEAVAKESRSPGVLAPTDLAALLESATVIVITDKGHGTGFFVNPTTVITNGHVVHGSKSISIANKTLGRTIPATLVNIAFTANTGVRDYAILQVAAEIQPATLPFTDDAEKLTKVAVAGYPGLYGSFDPNVAKPGNTGIPEMVMMEGTISVIHEFTPGIPVISHTASIYKGNSGGPLVNSCGQVVGINTFKLSTSETGRSQDGAVMINFTLGSADLLRYLKDQNVSLKLADRPCDA